MFSYVTVFEDEVNYYKNLAPESLLENISADGHYMIGAVNEDGYSIGAINFEIVQYLYDAKPYINIDWLYVDEDYRHQGHGHALIEEVIKLSKEAELDLRAQIPYPDVYNDITGFFTACGFDFIYADSFEFRDYLSTFAKSKYLGANVEKKKIIPLAKVPRGVYLESIKDLAKAQLGERYERVSLDRADYDEKLSVAYVEDDELKGIYLVSRLPDGTIVSGNLLCVKENISIISYNLINSFVTNAKKLCEADTLLVIKCQRAVSKRLLEFLLPNWTGEIVRKGYYR